MTKPTQMELTDAPVRAPMARRDDHDTSVAAAKAIEPELSELQMKVLTALEIYEAMTDGELEKLERFDGCRPSTVRKRRSELYQNGLVVKAGRRDGMTVWAVANKAALGEGT